jgi:hypothetical protein
MVGLTAAASGCVDPELQEFIDNPFRLRGRGTVDNLFCLLPARLSPAYALRESDSRLHAELKQFYAKVRNPIFHGNRLEADSLVDLVAPLDLISRVYGWVDSWRQVPESVRGLV